MLNIHLMMNLMQLVISILKMQTLTLVYNISIYDHQRERNM